MALSIPKSQSSGAYEYNILIEGQTVTAPQAQIEPCTSTIAESLGFVASPGNHFDKGHRIYMIGDVKQVVDLPLVEFYCEHTPI